MNNFFTNYIQDFHKLTVPNSEVLIWLENSYQRIVKCHQKEGKVIIVGNGGSAAIASHVSIDLTKAAQIRSINFNESSLLTCYGNDYGYENWVTEALKSYADSVDLVILISSSGSSKNMINAAQWCKDNQIPLITLTGMKNDNALKKIDSNAINFWLPSDNYNHIEMTHQLWLLLLVERLIAK